VEWLSGSNYFIGDDESKLQSNEKLMGDVILDIGEEVINKNLPIKIGLSLTNEEEKNVILIDGHACWDKHQ
jgi:hypothetical protein